MKNHPGYKMTPNLSSAVWAMTSFFTLSFAGQADAPCPVIEMWFKKVTIQRLNLSMNPRKPDTNSTCAVLNVLGSWGKNSECRKEDTC